MPLIVSIAGHADTVLSIICSERGPLEQQLQAKSSTCTCLIKQTMAVSQMQYYMNLDAP